MPYRRTIVPAQQTTAPIGKQAESRCQRGSAEGNNHTRADVPGMVQSRLAARAVGRCTGTLFFSIFGGCWLLVSSYWFHCFSLQLCLVDAVVVTGFVVTALRLNRRGEAAAKDAYPEAERKYNDRLFGIINAVMYVLVFLLFLVTPIRFIQLCLSRLHRTHRTALLSYASALPTSIQLCHRCFSCSMGIDLCGGLQHDGNIMAAFVTLGAGVTLWLNALWALSTARGLLTSEGL